ncbi:MAG: DUF4199 domain-containing protein [Paramuribaculum sp.]|nr:DUF4199 domain-containing protein [Paramuribaculum sp.]
MNQTFSPYRHGAYRGLPLGVYCGLSILVIAMADTIPFGGIIGLVLIVIYPVLIFKILHSASRDTEGTASLSIIWLSGLIAILGAAIVAGLIALIYFKWISPDYIFDRISQAAVMFADSPSESLREVSMAARTAIEQDRIPSAVEFTFSLMWFIVFVGVVITAILAPYVRIFYSASRWKNKNNT